MIRTEMVTDSRMVEYHAVRVKACLTWLLSCHATTAAPMDDDQSTTATFAGASMRD